MTKTEAKKLVQALTDEFGGETCIEPVNKHGRYRFVVTSDKFTKMPHLTRQDKVWVVVDKVLSREAILDISLILAFAPVDLAAVND